jgi:hypothetical protein
VVRPVFFWEIRRILAAINNEDDLPRMASVANLIANVNLLTRVNTTAPSHHRALTI